MSVMRAATPPANQADGLWGPHPRVRPLLREEYDRLVELGAFRDEKIELLDGTLCYMSPQGEPHAFTLMFLNRALVHAIGDRALVRVQMPIAASDRSEPEPDLALVALSRSGERPATAFLIVEVASTSLRQDLEVKLPLYAQARFPEVWVIDTEAQRALVFRSPELGSYRDTFVVERGGELSIVAFPDVRVPLDELFPPR